MSALDGGLLGGAAASKPIDGNESGFADGLQFALEGTSGGDSPATALIGGLKTVDADGSTALSQMGAESITLIAGASAANMVASGDRAIAIGHDVRAFGDNSICIGSGASASGGTSGNIAIGNSAFSVGSNKGCIALGHSATTNSVQDGIAIGRLAAASGNFGVALGNSSTAGGSSCAIGEFATASAAASISLGRRSDATATGAIAVGGDDSSTGAQATATGAIAIGGDDGTDAAAQATATNAMALGSGMANSIADTWVVRGANLTPQAAALTDWDKLAGCQITMVSPEDSALGTGDNRFDFPSGVSMFVDEIDIVVTELDGTVTTQPTTRAGSRNVADDAGNNEYFIAAALGTSLDTLRNRDRDTSMANDHAVTSLSGDITVVATLNTATVMGIRWVFKGYLLENE